MGCEPSAPERLLKCVQRCRVCADRRIDLAQSIAGIAHIAQQAGALARTDWRSGIGKALRAFNGRNRIVETAHVTSSPATFW